LNFFGKKGNASKLPADQKNKIRLLLDAINEASNVPQDLSPFRNWKIHALQGNLDGFWSLTVKENWRIIFKWEGKTLLTLTIWITIKNTKMKRGIEHNTHPGELLREEILEANNLTVTKAAAMLGVTRSALSHVINERAAVSPIMALRIAGVFGGNATFWIRMQAAYDLRKAEKEIADKKIKLKPFKFEAV